MREQTNQTTAAATGADGRALKIMAKSVYRELKSSGYGRSDVVAFTSALLELVTSEIKEDGTEPV
ncbi:MAG: hypothetical protein U0230_07525 [Polyangiales bacterium]